jgi:hypothetical protein
MSAREIMEGREDDCMETSSTSSAGTSSHIWVCQEFSILHLSQVAGFKHIALAYLVNITTTMSQ